MKNFSIAADIRLKHGKLWNWLQSHNLSVQDFAKITGISAGALYNYVAMRDFPRKEKTKMAIELATGIPCEELFPYEYVQFIEHGTKDRRFTITKEIPFAMLPGVNYHESLPAPDRLVEDAEHTQLLENAISQLKPREQEVLRLRFGIGGGDILTLDQIGKRFERSKEVIRQVEKRALEKLADILGRDFYPMLDKEP